MSLKPNLENINDNYPSEACLCGLNPRAEVRINKLKNTLDVKVSFEKEEIPPDVVKAVKKNLTTRLMAYLSHRLTFGPPEENTPDEIQKSVDKWVENYKFVSKATPGVVI